MYICLSVNLPTLVFARSINSSKFTAYDTKCQNMLQRGQAVDRVWNVMAHAQKPDFVFRAKRTSPFKSVCGGGGDVSSVDYCAAEVCASAVVMLDTPCSVVVWRVLAAHCIRQLPLHFLSLRPRVPSHFNWSLQTSAFPDLFTRWEERSDPESIYNVYLVFKNILQK